MTDEGQMTLAFIDRRPETAASVLETMPAIQAGVFLAGIPTRFALKALQSMNPRIAATIISSMEESSVTALIRDMDVSRAHSIMRQTAQGQRARLLANLSKRQQRGFATALSFGPDTVGARMTSAINILSENKLASDGLQVIRTDTDASCELILVVDEHERLLGVVSALALLQHSPTTKLLEMIDSSCTPLRSGARLAEIANISAWDTYSAVPVVNRRGMPIGVLTRKAMRITTSKDVEHDGPESQSLGSHLLDLISLCARNLAGVLVQPSSAPQSPGQKNER